MKERVTIMSTSIRRTDRTPTSRTTTSFCPGAQGESSRPQRLRVLREAGFFGQPLWTRSIEQRGVVFSYPRHVQRVDAVYNPGIKRYLLAAGFNHSGGWGIFDAPEPWGRWTTAFHTESWDVGGTHGYRLPSKWISSDGRTMHLIFSGVKDYDAFCVRKLTLEINGAGAP
jgi:hypothetical protein